MFRFRYTLIEETMEDPRAAVKEALDIQAWSSEGCNR